METQTEQTPQQTAEQFAEAAGLTYSAEFIPFSKSRMSAEKHPSLNWRVTISKGTVSITTDYMQGCAHIPHYSHAFSRLVIYDDAVREACERGTSKLLAGKKNGYDACQGGSAYARSKPIPPPALVDVMHSLVMESDVLNYDCFEDWADNFGYETDSRKAEKIYQDCMAIALKTRRLVDLDAARIAFQDY